MIRINSVDGQFHDGDPSTGTKGTILTAAWLNALQEAVIGSSGDIRTVSAATTLLETDGIVFGDTTAAAFTVHLPIYATVSSAKRYNFKNIGGVNAFTIDAIDGKTIDGAASIDLLPGDRCTIVKDGANWQTI